MCQGGKSVQCTLYSVQSVQCTECTVYRVSNVQCTLYRVYSVQCTGYRVQCTVYISTPEYTKHVSKTHIEHEIEQLDLGQSFTMGPLNTPRQMDRQTDR